MTTRPMVDLSIDAPAQVSYREIEEFGLPVVGSSQPYHTSRILRTETSVCVRAGYGNFDTAKPDQLQFGRTLHEVLAKSAAGEFRVLNMYQQWITCDKFGVRLMRYVEWLEYSRRPASDLVRSNSRNQLSPAT